MAILIIFGDRMANLGLIDFKIGLHIKVNIDGGQNKFKGGGGGGGVHPVFFVKLDFS